MNSDRVNTVESPALYDDGRYWVRTRYGWGWEVQGPNNYVSAPFGSQRLAIDRAAKLNIGTE